MVVSSHAGLQSLYDIYKNKGPTFIMRDMSARVGKIASEVEDSYIVKLIFHPQAVDFGSYSDEVRQNRDLLVSFLIGNKCILADTWFKKQEGKLATYRKPGVEQSANKVRPDFDQYDNDIAPRR